MLRSYINRQVLPHAIAGVLVLIADSEITELIVNLLEENQLERQRSAIVDKTAAMRANLASILNTARDPEITK